MKFKTVKLRVHEKFVELLRVSVYIKMGKSNGRTEFRSELAAQTNSGDYKIHYIRAENCSFLRFIVKSDLLCLKNCSTSIKAKLAEISLRKHLMTKETWRQ